MASLRSADIVATTMATPPDGPPPGFKLPDDESPLDVDALCKQMPAGAILRGMYMQGIVELCT